MLRTVAFRLCIARDLSHAAAVAQKADKNLLKKLRSHTGYSFVNCKNALIETDNDFDKALEHLKELARKEGWAKASKLQDRAASMGLVGLGLHGRSAVLVEMNCETDFVARNDRFRGLTAEITKHALALAETARLEPNCSVSKLIIDPLEDSAVANEVTDMIGSLGENIQFRRASALVVQSDLLLSGYVHPRSDDHRVSDQIYLGRYGTVLALKSTAPADLPADRRAALATQLCQHVVGMNPRQLGDQPTPDQMEQWKLQRGQAADAQRKAEEEERNRVKMEEGEEEIDVQAVDSSVSLLTLGDQDEERFLWQPFLLVPEWSVAEFCHRNAIQVMDFMRFKLGEERN